MERDLLERITINPNVMVGKPCIRDTRIPVELILRLLAQGIPEAEILADYLDLDPSDIRATLAFAARSVANEEVYPLTA